MTLYAVVFFICVFLLTAGLFRISLAEEHSPPATATTDDADPEG